MQVQREQWEFSPDTILVVSLHSNSLALSFSWIAKYLLNILQIIKSSLLKYKHNAFLDDSILQWVSLYEAKSCQALYSSEKLRTLRTLWPVNLRKGWAFFFAHWLVFLSVSMRFSFHKMKKKLKSPTSYFCFFFWLQTARHTLPEVKWVTPLQFDGSTKDHYREDPAEQGLNSTKFPLWCPKLDTRCQWTTGWDTCCKAEHYQNFLLHTGLNYASVIA